MTIKKKCIKKKACYCQGKKKNCRACGGTRVYKESIYYFIDDEQKIAFSGDTLK